MKITINLSDYKRNLKEIEKYSTKIEKNKKEILKKISERGEEIAKNNVTALGAFDSGNLAGSITHSYTEEKAVISTSCPYASYVEFGTGVVGSTAPHPLSGEMGITYDFNNHGEKGWYYYKNGKIHWTKGMPHRPFMYDTSQQLRNDIPQIIKECFKDDR